MKEIIIDYYKITEDPRIMQDKIRKHGADLLPKFLIGLFTLLLLQNWLPDLLGLAFPTSVSDIVATFSRGISADIVTQLPRIPIVLYLYALLFNGVFELGSAFYCLTFIRNRKVEFKALYEGINFYLKALGLYVFQTIIIAFWSMFFVIPGIIVALNFSQSYYILADDPDKAVPQILLESKMQMKGNRITYIKLIISYLPYILLGLIPAIAVEIFFNIDITTMNGVLIELAVNATFFTSLAYLALGQCLFYELLIQRGYNNFKYRNQDAFREL